MYIDTLNNLEGSNLKAQDRILINIPKLITSKKNKILNSKFSYEEIETALEKLHLDKAPGPNDFPTYFFKKCWHFLGQDMVESLESVRNSGMILREINNTSITLIPKKEKLENLEDFRPISLYNTIYKVLEKTLSNRMKPLLPFIIAEEKTSFILDRFIFDGIIIAQETIYSVQQNKKLSVLIKLDIQKGYDRFYWRFMCKFIESFVFSRQWINVIFECIATPRMSILVNGSLKGFFEISRGLQQGDPLSFYFHHNG